MSTALLMAAALALGQAEPAAPVAGAAAVAPAQAPAPAPAPAPTPAQAPPPAPAPAAAAATVSTTAQDVLEQPSSSVRPFEMPAAPPPGPVPYAEASNAKIPVKVEDYHRSYEGPEDAVEAYYDAGVRQAYQAEQALHGALDGMWTLSAADGAPLMLLVISDPGEGRGMAGGAWRDLSRASDPNAAGLIEAMTREGRAIVIRMTVREGAPAVTLRLAPGAEGRWRGTLTGGAAADRLVVMERKAL